MMAEDKPVPVVMGVDTGGPSHSVMATFQDGVLVAFKEIQCGPPDDWEPPSPKEPGDLIFWAGAVTEDRWGRLDIEIMERDYDGAFFWINEGVGLDYFLSEADHGDVVIEEDGVYVCEGLTVHYTRGDGWTTDDDEDWEDYSFRTATIEEIAQLFGCSFWDSDPMPVVHEEPMPWETEGV